jgi:hypothetical protein
MFLGLIDCAVTVYVIVLCMDSFHQMQAMFKFMRVIDARRTGTLWDNYRCALADSGLRVVHAVQIGDQAWAGWLPL